MLIEKFKYITIVFFEHTNSVKLMVQEHYDIPKYDGTLFILNPPNDYFTNTDNINLVKSFKHKIVYNLEHRFTKNSDSPEIYCFNEAVSNIITNDIHIDEFWFMDYATQFSEIVLNRIETTVKYKPVRYTSLIPHVNNINTTLKTIDLCFVGVINNRWYGNTNRIEFINNLEYSNYNISLKIIDKSKDLSSITTELNTSKYILDVLRQKQMLTQNQVRIFELLCMGYTVCAEKCDVNIFPGLIYEWSTLEDLVDIVDKNEYLNPTEAYKEMTYTDKAYENYVNNLIKLQDGI